MKISLRILTLSILGSIFFIFLYIFLFFLPNHSFFFSSPIIAIGQWSHPAVTATQEGIIEGIKKAGYKDAQIIYENAEGSMTKAIQISRQFTRLKPDIIVSIGTPMSQVLLPVSTSLKTPLVFVLVTDPKAAHLTPSSSRLVTGVSDFMDAKPQVDFFCKLFPKLRRIGIFYNPNEINSVSYLKHFEETLKAFPSRLLTLVKSPLASRNELGSVLPTLIGKVDVIYYTNDNVAMSAAKDIAEAVLAAKIPLLANDRVSVEKGALAALSFDRFKAGLAAANLIAQILSGRIPEDLPVVYQNSFFHVFNKKTAEQLSLTVPPEVLKDAIVIE